MIPQIDSPIAKLIYDENTSILHVKVFERSEMNVMNTIEYYKLISEITSNCYYGALIDAEHYFEIDNDALKLSATPELLGRRIATAHYSDNLANRLNTHFFKNNSSPPIPFEYFKTKKEALSWLKTKILEFKELNNTQSV